MEPDQERYKRALEKCYSVITESLNFDDIKSKLIPENVISLAEKGVIEELTGEHNRIGRLLDTLERSNLEVTYPRFRSILQEVQKHHIVRLLDDVVLGNKFYLLSYLF